MKTSRFHILMLLTAMAALFVAVAIYAYLYYETGVLTDQAITARSLFIAEEKDRSEGKDLLTVYQTTASARAQLPSFFVPADNAVVFIQTIESIGASSGADVAISSIADNPPSKPRPGSIGSITAHVTASGSWSAVMRTLALFETLPYRSALNRVSLGTSIIVGESPSAAHPYGLSFDVSASTLVGSAQQATATSTQ